MEVPLKFKVGDKAFHINLNEVVHILAINSTVHWTAMPYVTISRAQSKFNTSDEYLRKLTKLEQALA